MDKALKICLLTLGTYSVPALEGGAVETLVEIMAQNYQSGDFNCSLDIISKYFEPAVKQSEKYSKVKFHYIKYSHRAMRVYKFIKRVSNKLFGTVLSELDPYFSKALKIIKKEKYDVVIVENAIYYVEPLKKHTDSTVVFHFHNDFESFVYHKPELRLKNADMMITVSDYVADNAKAYKFSYPVVTVKNVIDTVAFSKVQKSAREEIREKYGFSENDVVCMFAGRLIPEKGIHLLLDSIEKTDGIKLLVVGGTSFMDSQKNEFEEKLYEKAKKLGGRVVFTGYVDYKSIPEYYHACDIAVFPSQCAEAAGLVVLEAQSAGKPVIISNAGGMPEYVCDKSALIVEMDQNFTQNLAKAVILLANDSGLRKAMGDAGMNFAKEFDKGEYFENILKALAHGKIFRKE